MRDSQRHLGVGLRLVLAAICVMSCSKSTAAPDNSPPSPTAPGSISFVQAKADSGTGKSLVIKLDSATVVGDLIVVAFDYAATTFASITDSQGNEFTEVGSEISSPHGALTRMYYAKNVKGGAESVTVNLAASTTSLEVYVAEYRGADLSAPLDATAQNAGSTPAVASGSLTTTSVNDMLVAYCVGDTYCNSSQGFTPRLIFHSNLLEDFQLPAAGQTSASGTAGDGWAMIAAAFKPQPLALYETRGTLP